MTNKSEYTSTESAKHAKSGMAERDRRAFEYDRDMSALELVQASRPLKQGQVSFPVWVTLYGKRAPYRFSMNNGQVLMTLGDAPRAKRPQRAG